MKPRRFPFAAAALIGASVLTPLGTSHAATLFSLGPVVDGSGLSEIRTGGNFYGFAAQANLQNFLAEDFVVPIGEAWDVTDFIFYSYQTGAASTFTFLDATWSIVSGTVDGPVIASGTTPVSNGGLMGYRVTSTTLTNTDRAIFALNANVPDFSLTPGNYFLRWGITGSLGSGPWVPPTSDGVAGNALQSISNGPFNPLIDGNDQLGVAGVALPFAINGDLSQISAIPEPSSLLGLGCMLMTALGIRSRRSS